MIRRVRRASGGKTNRDAVVRAIACCDVTSLGSSDTSERVGQVAERALHPAPHDASVPSAAAVCTWPHLLPAARDVLSGSPVKLAAATGDFPAGRASVADKVAEVRAALELGAGEVDAVMNRSAVEQGRLEQAYEEVRALREAAPAPTLKVILETGELGAPNLIRRAALVALVAGADMVKTSTGKTSRGASLEAACVLVDAVRDVRDATGLSRGLKIAGGVRRTEQALAYMTLVENELGSDWLVPQSFRIGASTLLDDLVKAL